MGTTLRLCGSRPTLRHWVSQLAWQHIRLRWSCSPLFNFFFSCSDLFRGFISSAFVLHGAPAGVLFSCAGIDLGSVGFVTLLPYIAIFCFDSSWSKLMDRMLQQSNAVTSGPSFIQRRFGCCGKILCPKRFAASKVCGQCVDVPVFALLHSL